MKLLYLWEILRDKAEFGEIHQKFDFDFLCIPKDTWLIQSCLDYLLQTCIKTVPFSISIIGI